jgi:hypothetical protein
LHHITLILIGWITVFALCNIDFDWLDNFLHDKTLNLIGCILNVLYNSINKTLL